MRRIRAFVVPAALAAFACQETPGPVAADQEIAGPAAAVTCPCWDPATLGIAFPTAHLFREVDGTAALTRFDHTNAQQLQALVQLAPDGRGSCELASFGAAGLVEALSGAAGLDPGQCAACAALLERSAAALGMTALPPDGEGS
jgi:hypothetical protein